jgi:hypothetical protein
MLIYSIIVTVLLLGAIALVLFYIQSSSSKEAPTNLLEDNLKLKEQLSMMNEKVKSLADERICL